MCVDRPAGRLGTGMRCRALSCPRRRTRRAGAAAAAAVARPVPGRLRSKCRPAPLPPLAQPRSPGGGHPTRSSCRVLQAPVRKAPPLVQPAGQPAEAAPEAAAAGAWPQAALGGPCLTAAGRSSTRSREPKKVGKWWCVAGGGGWLLCGCVWPEGGWAECLAAVHIRERGLDGCVVVYGKGEALGKLGLESAALSAAQGWTPRERTWLRGGHPGRGHGNATPLQPGSYRRASCLLHDQAPGECAAAEQRSANPSFMGMRRALLCCSAALRCGVQPWGAGKCSAPRGLWAITLLPGSGNRCQRLLSGQAPTTRSPPSSMALHGLG